MFLFGCVLVAGCALLLLLVVVCFRLFGRVFVLTSHLASPRFKLAMRVVALTHLFLLFVQRLPVSSKISSRR